MGKISRLEGQNPKEMRSNKQARGILDKMINSKSPADLSEKEERWSRAFERAADPDEIDPKTP